VGTLVVTKVGFGAGDEAIEFDAITNRPFWPPLAAAAVAEYGIQNPPEPLPIVVAQEMATLVMFDVPTMPEPSLTVQVWPVGWVPTVTA
jgi:hypothetical protein